MELELETCKGNHIDNVQESAPIPIGVINGFEDRYSRQFPNIKRRTHNATAQYNCHGLVFAARRTQIFEAHQVNKIIADDGYKRIAENEVLPGDIALYISEKGAIDHSAVVIELDNSELSFRIHKVYSKWGPWIEVIHWANECPYAQEPGTSINYFRLVR